MITIVYLLGIIWNSQFNKCTLFHEKNSSFHLGSRKDIEKDTRKSRKNKKAQ